MTKLYKTYAGALRANPCTRSIVAVTLDDVAGFVPAHTATIERVLADSAFSSGPQVRHLCVARLTSGFFATTWHDVINSARGTEMPRRADTMYSTEAAARAAHAALVEQYTADFRWSRAA